MDSKQKMLLVQIYNFVILKPSFSDKSEYMKLRIFFSELHEPKVSDFDSIKPYSFEFGFCGVKRWVNTLYAPSIMDKDDFIPWLISNLQ